MQRVCVTDTGVEVHHQEPPLVSMYGKQMRPARAWIAAAPWDEISAISIGVLSLPPDGERRISLEIDLIWGEYLEVGQNAEGFAEAVARIAARAGAAPPDLSTLDGVVTLWGP